MLSTGTKLGPYEIVAPIGAGGMGEVYKARDTRLDRVVAVKVLPAHLAEDPGFCDRFEREAKTIASLEHPHICALYDVGEAGGVRYLVMPLLEGESLAARIAKGALPVEQAITYAIQIADGLAAAHRHVVVHRDLKPGNVMLTKSGAKLLDFGLAKNAAVGLGVRPAASAAARGATYNAAESALATQAPLTAQGTILGTFHYMAPEQIEGREADARSDLFAFGAVLYEMLTGRRAFDGKTPASLITAIMGSEPPPISTQPHGMLPLLDHIVTRCLAKDPDARWQSASDVMNELKWALQSGSQAIHRAAPTSRELRRTWLPWGVAAVLFLTTFAVGWTALRSVPNGDRRPIPFTISPPEGTVFAGGSGGAPYPTISPDGTQLVFAAVNANNQQLLWVRPLDSLTARPLAGTDGAIQPFWSPDGRSVGFFAEGKLKRIELAGGAAQTVCDAPASPRKAAWSPEGVIVFALGGQPLHRVPSGGGVPTPLTKLDASRDELGHVYPHFLPDGRHFLFVGSSAKAEQSGIYVGSLDSPQITRILAGLSEARYAEPGYLLYMREGTLLAQPFDARRFELSGEPITVAESVSFTTLSGIASYSTSNTGVLAYRPGSPATTRLVWRGRSGKELGVLAEPAAYISLDLSPDERQVAVGRYAGAGSDIWLLDIARGFASRFTFSPGYDMDAMWSLDGSRLAFASNRAGPGLFYLYQRSTSSAGEEELVMKNELFPRAWSADGRTIIGATRRGTVVAGSLDGDREPQVLARLNAAPAYIEVSPDRTWVAYSSVESGRSEIYIQRLTPGGGKWQVSTHSGSMARWRWDMRELFYQASDQKLMAVSLNLEPASPEIGVPTTLFESRMLSTGGLSFGARQQYAVTRDGQRFLLNEAAAGFTSEIVVVLNWDARLRRP